ncbi:integrase, catalytic region, zinc finger, CCHC-type containing protein [Tanacetum coccineum]
MIIREVFVKLLLKSSGKLSIRHGLYETIVCYVLLANMIWIVVLERDRLKALMDLIGFKGELHENIEVREILFLYCYAFSVSLLLTPLCCDDIHDVTPRVSALAACDSPDCTVRFEIDQIARIMGYGDYQLGNVIISRVYYVEELGHNLFSVGQFCDVDLEVAFWKNTCFIRNLEGVDLLSGSRDTNLYTISLDDMLKSSPICLISKASKTKSWLWHHRLSHLNFGTLNKLAKDGLARGIPRC